MTHDILLNTEMARLMLLSAQGLLNPPAQAATKDAVLETIRRMGALQIDTINVVARSPYLVLFSRIGDYDPDWLDALEAEGKLFEYWSHAACFLPIEDYRLYRYRMDKDTQRYYSPEWGEKHHATITAVLGRIRDQGPVRSADFERTDGRKGSWWDWKVEKQVLEYLHTTGDLMIVHRENFQRIYDLRERVLPGWDETQALSMEEARDVLAARAVRVLGAAPARWVPDYFRLPKNGASARLERLTKAGQLVQVKMEGWKEPWYVNTQNLPLLEQARSGELKATCTTLLSPFDPLTWDRERAKTLFQFEYSIECYLPESKRKYGYFSLPILHQGALIGRLAAKAHRKDGVFEVRALYLEPGTELTEGMAFSVRQAIQRCADWHGTPKVEIRKTEPGVFAEMLREGIEAKG